MASNPVRGAALHNYDLQKNGTVIPEVHGTEFTPPLQDGRGNIAIKYPS
jgi:hypothetical protein